MTRPSRGGKGAPPLIVEIEATVEAGDWGDPDHLVALARTAVDAAITELALRSPMPAELGLVLTDDASIRALNAQWRGKDKATNVLSFPAFPDPGPDRIPPMLGDIVLAQETVAREATLEQKPFDHHFTHLVVHGFLHLLGHDHETEEEAETMEAAERRILAALAIPDPYAVTDED